MKSFSRQSYKLFSTQKRSIVDVSLLKGLHEVSKAEQGQSPLDAAIFTHTHALKNFYELSLDAKNHFPRGHYQLSLELFHAQTGETPKATENKSNPAYYLTPRLMDPHEFYHNFNIHKHAPELILWHLGALFL